MAFLKRIARVDPLVLFLIAGLALYLVLDAAGLVRGNDRVIVVDEARLSAFMASQGGRDPGGKASLLDAAERRELIAAYVRDEALYREALALGLDREDSAIRRRLVQSLRFSLQDEGNDEATAGKPSDAELRATRARSVLCLGRDRVIGPPPATKATQRGKRQSPCRSTSSCRRTPRAQSWCRARRETRRTSVRRL